MSRRVLLVLLALAGAACSDQGAPTIPSGAAIPRATTAGAARERLARALAVALSDPATRAAVKRRLDASNAPEGKLQFQALVRTDQGGLLAMLARAEASSPTELLADLDAARSLELYLPVPAQRASWTGDGYFMVGTIGGNGEQPVGFDPSGVRHELDRNAPPAIPVLALVPQETDFTRGHANLMTTCVDMCNEDDTGAGGSFPTSGGTTAMRAAGVYLTRTHFTESFESWIKGSPEFEFHVYGTGDNGQSVQLACTAQQQLGVYYWEGNSTDWNGSTMLISDADYNLYQSRHPNSPIRIVAWEDDDEPCVDHADATTVSSLVSAVDNAYKAVTSGKSDPWYLHGLKSAVSVFNLIATLHNVILTNDEFIGNAVEGTITGDAPSGSNWVLKTEGTVTTGWFTTTRVR